MIKIRKVSNKKRSERFIILKLKYNFLIHPRGGSNPDSSDGSVQFSKLGVRCLNPLGHVGKYYFFYTIFPLTNRKTRHRFFP